VDNGVHNNPTNKMETQLVLNDRITQLLDQTNLNWKVKESPMFTKLFREDGGWYEIPLDDKKALVREDDHTVLGIHSDGYVPYQNYEMLELLDKVSQQTGLPIHRGGLFGNGKKVFIQLQSHEFRIQNVGGVWDTISGYVTGINSFDGSTSLSFGPSTKTISCQNTFFGAYREMGTKIRHTKNMGVKIDEVCRRIEGVLVEERNNFENIKRMSESPFEMNTLDSVIRTMFDLDRDVDLKDTDKLSGVTRNKLSRFYIDLNGELREKGNNVWGLMSGVTKYTTHSVIKGDNSEKKMFGSTGNRERKIFSDLVEYTNHLEFV
jgi:phage/plasmid-like protein (TIGR03299 family)